MEYDRYDRILNTNKERNVPVGWISDITMVVVVLVVLACFGVVFFFV